MNTDSLSGPDRPPQNLEPLQLPAPTPGDIVGLALCDLDDPYESNALVAAALGGATVPDILGQFRTMHDRAASNTQQRAEGLIRDLQVNQGVFGVGLDAVARTHHQVAAFIEADVTDGHQATWRSRLEDHQLVTQQPLPQTDFQLGVGLSPLVRTEIPGSTESTQYGYLSSSGGDFFNIEHSASHTPAFFSAPMLAQTTEGQTLVLDTSPPAEDDTAYNTYRRAATNTLIALCGKLKGEIYPHTLQADVVEGVSVVPVIEESVGRVERIGIGITLARTGVVDKGELYFRLLCNSQAASEAVVGPYQHNVQLGGPNNQLLIPTQRDEESRGAADEPFTRPEEEVVLSLLAIPVHKETTQPNAPHLVLKQGFRTEYLKIDSTRKPTITHLGLIASY
jgi:hypothetical protein